MISKKPRSLPPIESSAKSADFVVLNASIWLCSPPDSTSSMVDPVHERCWKDGLAEVCCDATKSRLISMGYAWSPSRHSLSVPLNPVPMPAEYESPRATKPAGGCEGLCGKPTSRDASPGCAYSEETCVFDNPKGSSIICWPGCRCRTNSLHPGNAAAPEPKRRTNVGVVVQIMLHKFGYSSKVDSRPYRDISVFVSASSGRQVRRVSSAKIASKGRVTPGPDPAAVSARSGKQRDLRCCVERKHGCICKGRRKKKKTTRRQIDDSQMLNMGRRQRYVDAHFQGPWFVDGGQVSRHVQQRDDVTGPCRGRLCAGATEIGISVGVRSRQGRTATMSMLI